MKQLTIAYLLLLALPALPALASNPGEPLDCSDWVFLEPGLYCLEYPPSTPNPPFSGSGVDNQGRPLIATSVSTPLTCGGSPFTETAFEIRAWSDGQEITLARLSSRCGAGANIDVTTGGASSLFIEETGRLLFERSSSCNGIDCSYDPVDRLIAIAGFPTVFDILSTFTPTADEIGFATPYMPEGFQYADYFDTYTGDLATVGDWSQAQPLQCGYPSTPPNVGDYMTVPDTLPDPSPGQGRYYVTAVNYLGDKRYGRKRIGGVLSGRDSAMLPACN